MTGFPKIRLDPEKTKRGRWKLQIKDTDGNVLAMSPGTFATEDEAAAVGLDITRSHELASLRDDLADKRIGLEKLKGDLAAFDIENMALKSENAAVMHTAEERRDAYFRVCAWNGGLAGGIVALVLFGIIAWFFGWFGLDGVSF